MKLFRKVLFWSHLATGALVAGVVIIMAATGVLLTYQKQMTAWADRRAVDAGPPTQGATRLSADELLNRATGAGSEPTSTALRSEPTSTALRSDPTSTTLGSEPTSLVIRSHPDAPAEIVFGRERQLVNAYTGASLGAGSTGMREFFRVVTAWHRTLGATGDNRALGRMITGAANLGFLFLVVTGFYLWWPRNLSWTAFRNVLWYRRRLRGKASDFNWHNVIGFWSLVPLFLIVSSGVVISYRWAGNLVYRVAGEAPPAARAAPSGPQTATAGTRPAGEAIAQGETDDSPPPRRAQLDRFVTIAQQRVPEWKTLTITLPKRADTTVSVAIDAGSGGQPQLRSTLVLDARSGEEIRHDTFSEQTAGRRLRSFLRFVHTGEVYGVVGQTLAGLVCFGTLVLAWTGVALAMRRLRSWRSRRATARAAVPEGAGERVEQLA